MSFDQYGQDEKKPPQQNQPPQEAPGQQPPPQDYQQPPPQDYQQPPPQDYQQPPPQGYQQPPPQGYQQPPPGYGPPPKGNSKTIMIVALVAVVAIVAVAMLVMFMGGGARSPEGAVETFIGAAQDENFEKTYGALSYSLYYTDEEKQEMKDSWEDGDWKDDSDVKITQMNTIRKGDLTQDHKDEYQFETLVNWFDDEHNIKVQDYALVEVTARVTDDGETNTEEGEFMCVKVDGKWYVHIDYEYMYASWQDTDW